jgi:hypothetical protein
MDNSFESGKTEGRKAIEEVTELVRQMRWKMRCP